MKRTLKILIVIIIFGITFFISSLLYKVTFKEDEDKEEEVTEVFLNNSSNTNERIEVLRREFDNEDIKGIISSSAIGLNAVVVQSSDNNYYMDHNINKENDVVGSIFIDYRNNFSSKKLLIYGHNSENIDTDFGKLEAYLEPEFAKNNSYIEFVTTESVTKWEIFSVMVIPNNTTTHTRIEFSSAAELQDHIDWMIKNSEISFNSEVNINDQLMTLQTCYYEPKDSFLLINLKKVEDNND